MLKKRLITVLTFYRGVLYRSKMFTPDYRYTMNFVDAWSIDEVVVLDITRPEDRDRDQFVSLVHQFSEKCFVPLCVGGGVDKLDDFKCYLDAGADKVSINNVIFTNPNLITRAAERFGSQCVVASIDVKKNSAEGDYIVHRNCGRTPTGWRPESLAREVEKLGAGEILLTSIDKDGSLEGYDNTLNAQVTESVSIPVVVCGGAGKWQDFVEGFILGGADAVATSNIYHFTESSVKSAKKYLFSKGIDVRI